jgi:hypothetical protein
MPDFPTIEPWEPPGKTPSTKDAAVTGIPDPITIDAAVVNPLSMPTRYDHILLNGEQSPGLARVEGAELARKWNVQQGLGLSGAVCMYGGDELAKFTVTLQLWLTDHFTQLSRFRKLLDKPPAGQRPKPMDIYHPYLDELGIKKVVIESHGQLEQKADGMWEMPIKFLQYRAPKPQSGKASDPKKQPEDSLDGMLKDAGNSIKTGMADLLK